MKEYVKSDLVSPCGIYCGACKKFKARSCAGCVESKKKARCKVRACVIEKKIHTCASCDTYKNTMECHKLNNFMSKLFSRLFNLDKNASLNRIKKVGPLRYAREMYFKNQSTIKRR